MRQETNNEIDLLLRRLSQRPEGTVSDADLHVDSDHLDADELSAYAENALPAAARMRYTEHLADCSKCRELVVQLSASVPVVTAKDTVVAPESSGLRRFLASFFSPMVLRYAIPALGVIIVAAIGFIGFRSNRPRQDLAQTVRTEPASPPASPAPANDPQQLSGYLSDSAGRTKSQPPVTSEQKVDHSGDVVAQRPAPQSTVTPSTSDTAKADRREFMREPAAANAAPPPTQPAPKPAATVDEMSIEAQGRRSTDQTSVAPTGDLAKQKTAEAPREQEKKAEDLRAAQGRGRGEAASPQSGAGIANVRRREAMISKDGDDGETRSAGGREFRRQNGVWIDTAYQAGNAVVSVARTSEQYRSLVADEPGIKTIADQLAGPIIVVWKGRTYRIR